MTRDPIETVGFSLTDWVSAPVDFVSRNVEVEDVAKVFASPTQQAAIEQSERAVAQAKRSIAQHTADQAEAARRAALAKQIKAHREREKMTTQEIAKAKLKLVLAHLKQTDPPKYRQLVAHLLRVQAQQKRAAARKRAAAAKAARARRVKPAPSLSRRGRAELAAKRARASRGYLVASDGRILHGNWRAA